MFVYNCQPNSSESLLQCNIPNTLHVSALYLGHLQAYIRGGVHYTLVIPIRGLVLRKIKLWVVSVGYCDRGSVINLLNPTV
jgi:hypothetical protein